MGSNARVVRRVGALVNGYEVTGSLEEFQPPILEKETDDNKGGNFVGFKIVTGVMLQDWSLNLSECSPELIFAMGLGANSIVTVYESVTADGVSTVRRTHVMSGEVTGADQGATKPGKESMTLKGSPFAYKLTEGSRTIHDVNARTKRCIVGGVDLLEGSNKDIDF